MPKINWVRATFVGAILGGIVWAVILSLAIGDVPDIPWGARMLTFSVAINAVLLAVSALLWRSDEKRTLAAALWIVPFVGVAFIAASSTVAAGFKVLGA